MDNIELIRSFYNNYKYLQVKRGYKATLAYDVIFINQTSSANLIYENKQLKLFLSPDTELSYDLLNNIGYFFPNYDFDNDYAYINLESGINLFFYEGNKRLHKFGIRFHINFDEMTKRKLVYNLLRKIDTDNKDLVELLVKDFDNLAEITFPELKEKCLSHLSNIEENKRIENITCMDLPLDWSNFYEGSDLVKEEYCDDVSVALIKSIRALGKVDVEYISEITKMKPKDVIYALKGAIYQNPEKWDECFYKGWETKDEYLTGQIKHKLKVAKEANQKYNGYFTDNVEALSTVVPKELTYDEVYITLGSPWVPAKVIDDFIAYISGGRKHSWWKGPDYDTVHDEYTGTWEIPNKNRYYKNVKVESTYDTSKINALHIIERTLNMKTITIYDEITVGGLKPKKIKVINQNETLLALEKQQLLIETFKKWVWDNDERKKMLLDIYESKYCSNVVRKFDGSFLTFKGLSKDVELYDYQKNAVARIILTNNTLLAHDVGAGKTYIMCAAGMELRRMGISKKNLYVVPNTVVSQWNQIFKEMYPDANLLCVTPNTFKKEKREEILAKIRDEDYDGIIISYSCFDLIPVSKQYVMETLEDEIKILTHLVNSKKKATKQLKNKLERLEKEFDKLNNGLPDIRGKIYFNDLGINTIFVDEAHNFKNVPIDTKINRVLGINTTGSKKCLEMMHKVHFIQKQNGGRGVVFATGTPITNSLTDIYVMQKYLQNGELNILDLNSFDSWIGMFAEKEAEFEIDVDTSTYRLATRFRRYHNMPELSALLANVSDFYQIDKLNDLPELDGYTDVVIKKSIELKDYLSEISSRAELVRNNKVNRKEDNMLKITTDGRKAALDMRLVNNHIFSSYHSKAARCVENVFNIYRNTKENKSTQLIFCDTSTPKEGFNLYDDIKLTLLSLGVPKDQIAFIHDAENEKERLQLFDKVQKGDIRILLGSTFKLGTGVNVQNKLIAIHHLDVPWRPSDMTQREGRILRKGNENKKVKIFRYITDGSFDAYSWQLLESKQRMINAVLEGNMTERMCQEVDDLVLSYAEVKALAIGNPNIKRRVEIENEISKLRVLQNKAIKNKQLLELELLSLPKKVDNLSSDLIFANLDNEYYKVNKIKYTQQERKEYREQIFKELIDCDLIKEEKVICNYQGFDVIMPTNMIRNKPYIYLKKNLKYKLDLGTTDIGIIVRIDNFLEDLDKFISDLMYEKEKVQTRINDINIELSKENTYSDSINELKEELNKIDKKLGVKK